MGFGSEVSRFWRLAESVNVIQAALLIIGVEPQTVEDYVENWAPEKRPENYTAARDAIVGATRSGTLEGSICFVEYEGPMGNFEIDETRIDYGRSRVNVRSLIDWLQASGFDTDSLALPTEKPKGFRDPDHPRYSPKLMAVVEAWENFDTESDEPGTPKQRLMKWLRLNASRFGLTDDDGKPSENVIEELAKVANWATAGGAPKTKIEQSGPD